ncbi:MAG: PQQ-binding-like beta-propeller repeat protein, partial [Planctomycetes bacterium]|nr:PQQ-binding-like beta-propeller repeat protein [Planctomycetota bacterium]
MKRLGDGFSAAFSRSLVTAAWLVLVLPAAAAIADEEPATTASVERQVFERVLLNDRRLAQVLDRAAAELKAGRVPQGLELVQQLLDRGEDRFVWLEKENRVSSIRREAGRLIASTPAVLAAYERLYGPEARRLLDEATRRGQTPLRTSDLVHRETIPSAKGSDPFTATLSTVARRFYYTEAGFEAIDRLATVWMDQGRFDAAARAWRQLLEDPAHGSRMTPRLAARAATAFAHQGDEARVRDALVRLRGRELLIGGQRRDIHEWIEREAHGFGPVGFSGRQPAWPVFGGDASRGLVASGGGPPDYEPLWAAPLFEEPATTLRRFIENWQSAQRSQHLPAAAANYGVVSAGKLVVRDLGGISAMDLESGRTMWRWRSPVPLQVRVPGQQPAPAIGRRPRAAGIDRMAVVAPNANDVANRRTAWIGNSMEGLLAADERHVYAVRLNDVSPPNPAAQLGGRQPAGGLHTWNRLIALPLSAPASGERGQTPLRTRDAEDGDAISAAKGSDPVAPRWTIGGPPDGDGAFAGHFFLGAPLPVDGRLYVLTEANRQINLVALNAATGELVWTQGLGYIDRSIDSDPGRYFHACVPSYSGGIVVCPTGMGLVVGVDAVRGNLLWTHLCESGSEDEEVGDERRAVGPRRSYGYSGFEDVPQIAGGRVVFLSRASSQLRCFDLESGRLIWSLDRQDGEYVGGITEGVVVVVGTGQCRGVSFDTGEILWAQLTGLPGGRGAMAGRAFLLPLADGRIAALDVHSGRETGLGPTVTRSASEDHGSNHLAGASGYGRAETANPAGNLIVAGRYVLSIGTFEVAAHRQADRALDEVLATIDAARKAGKEVESATLLRAAKLELILDRSATAEERLETVRREARSAAIGRQATALLRESLYRRLDRGEAADPALLERLEQLTEAPRDRARLFLRQSETLIRNGSHAAALDAIERLATLNLSEPLPLPENPMHRIAPATWVPWLLEKLEQTPDGRAHVAARVAERRDATLEAGDAETLERFLATWSSRPEAAAVRALLAEKLLQQGEWHRAELLLLKNHETADASAAASATFRLARFWDDCDFPEDAAAMLHDLRSRFPAAPIRQADGQPAAALVESDRWSAGTRAALRVLDDAPRQS